MASTYTYTINMAAQPKAPHTGTQSLAWDVLIGGTNKFGSISDVLLLGKLPNGALITKADFQMSSLAETATYAFVLLATEAAGSYSVYATLKASVTTSPTAVTTVSLFRPTKISLSDDRAVQYVTLALNCTTGVSGTVSFSTFGKLDYLADGSNV